jgi:hypothetical protein
MVGHFFPFAFPNNSKLHYRMALDQCTFSIFETHKVELFSRFRVLHLLEEDIFIMHIMLMVAYNTQHLFKSNKYEEGGQSIVNHNVGVVDILSRMREVPTLFEVSTDVEVRKFDELTSLVGPTIHDNISSKHGKKRTAVVCPLRFF